MKLQSKVPIRLPFKGEWFVFWGGDSKKLNQHHNNPAQKYAFDFVIVDKKGKTYSKSRSRNENYYCFNQEVVAPANGIVVQVIDGVDDNQPGYLNGYWVPGNTVIIENSKKLYSVLSHFKQNSVKTKVGQKIKAGDLLGLCGNSGNSSEPHLHFHLQDKANILFAKGVKCYFSKVEVTKNKKTIKINYSPIKADIVSSSSV